MCYFNYSFQFLFCCITIRIFSPRTSSGVYNTLLTECHLFEFFMLITTKRELKKVIKMTYIWNKYIVYILVHILQQLFTSSVVQLKFKNAYLWILSICPDIYPRNSPQLITYKCLDILYHQGGRICCIINNKWTLIHGKINNLSAVKNLKLLTKFFSNNIHMSRNYRRLNHTGFVLQKQKASLIFSLTSQKLEYKMTRISRQLKSKKNHKKGVMQVNILHLSIICLRQYR